MGQNMCRGKRYACTFKAVEAGMCMYLHILRLRLSRLVCADIKVCDGACTYQDIFSLFWYLICYSLKFV